MFMVIYNKRPNVFVKAAKIKIQMEGDIMYKLDNFQNILNEFQKIYTGKHKNKSKSFLEIAKMPHSELVFSNILAFYFDVNGEHELHDLMLKALIDVASLKIEKDVLDLTVEREYITNSGNYIDLVLYNDDFAIGIENKIYSGVYNDLEDYADAIEKINKNAYKIILSINDESEIAQEHQFINVTYKELFNKVSLTLTNQFDSENKWHVFLKDFMQNIENLYGGGHYMDSKMIEWTSSNKDKINDFYGYLMELKEDINNKTIELQKELNEQLKGFDFIDYIWVWNKSGMQAMNYKLYTICVIELKKYKIALDNYLDADGWKIEISFRGRNGYEGLRQEIINKLEEDKLNYDCYDKNHIRVFEHPYAANFAELVKNNITLLNIIK